MLKQRRRRPSKPSHPAAVTQWKLRSEHHFRPLHKYILISGYKTLEYRTVRATGYCCAACGKSLAGSPYVAVVDDQPGKTVPNKRYHVRCSPYALDFK